MLLNDRQKRFGILFEFRRAHAPDVGEALTALRQVKCHLLKRGIAENDIWGHVPFCGQPASQLSQRAEQRLIIVERRAAGA